MKTAVIALLLLCSQSVFAGGQSCQFEYWKSEKNLPNRELHIQFDSINRERLKRIYYGELTKSQKKPFMEALSTYLIQTELKKEDRAYLKLLKNIAEIENKTFKNTKPIAQKELCAVNDKFRLKKLNSHKKSK